MISRTLWIRSKKLMSPSFLAIVGFEVTPARGNTRAHFFISSKFKVSSINSIYIPLYYKVCSVRPIISSCVALDSTLKKAE